MADVIRTTTTEQIFADAEMIATFLRQIIAQDIPLSAAVALASTYLSSHILTRANHEKPKDPWEGGPRP